MSPRSYNLGRRQDQIDESRRQVLDGARALLREAPSYTAFTLDAVAKRADVARGTVYYQFGSKAGLLEAVCDDLAELGGLAGLAEAFGEPDPTKALAGFVACFGRFWQADRAAMRRLRALAALDPDIHAVIDARDQRRRQGLEVLVARLATRRVGRSGAEPERAVLTLQVLTSFETFDGLARPDQPLDEVVGDVMDLIRRFLDARR
jgi:AcrR family transcriptional regulator